MARAASASTAAAKPRSVRTAGWIPRASSRSSSRPSASSSLAWASRSAAAAGSAVSCDCGDAKPEGERDEALLRAVVQVPFEPLPLGVACLDDGARDVVSCSRASALASVTATRYVNFGDSRLDAGAELVRRGRRDREGPPEAPGDDDRCRDAGRERRAGESSPEPRAAPARNRPSMDGRSHGRATARRLAAEGATEVDPVVTGAMPSTDELDLVRALDVPSGRCQVAAEQASDLLGHDVEQLFGLLRGGGDRDAAERGLLVGQGCELLPGLGVRECDGDERRELAESLLGVRRKPLLRL